MTLLERAAKAAYAESIKGRATWCGTCGPLPWERLEQASRDHWIACVKAAFREVWDAHGIRITNIELLGAVDGIADVFTVTESPCGRYVDLTPKPVIVADTYYPCRGVIGAPEDQSKADALAAYRNEQEASLYAAYRKALVESIEADKAAQVVKEVYAPLAKLMQEEGVQIAYEPEADTPLEVEAKP